MLSGVLTMWPTLHDRRTTTEPRRPRASRTHSGRSLRYVRIPFDDQNIATETQLEAGWGRVFWRTIKYCRSSTAGANEARIRRARLSINPRPKPLSSTWPNRLIPYGAIVTAARAFAADSCPRDWSIRPGPLRQAGGEQCGLQDSGAQRFERLIFSLSARMSSRVRPFAGALDGLTVWSYGFEPFSDFAALDSSSVNPSQSVRTSPVSTSSCDSHCHV